MIEIDGKLVNKNNICYIHNRITDTDGYTYKRTYHINITFTGGDTLQVKTYDKEEFDKWWEMLKNDND